MEASEQTAPAEEGAAPEEHTAPVEETEDTEAADVEPDAADDETDADDDAVRTDEDHAPVAERKQDAIIGDPGLRNEQSPQVMEGGSASVDTPVRTSAPPPSAQSGVPLAEDRAAGVEPESPVGD